PLSYNHTPFIIFSPKYLQTKSFKKFGGQIDVFPTLMSILNISYINNTMGIDLITETRPFIYFSADDKIGCINDEFFFIYETNGSEALYKYKQNDITNYRNQYKNLVDEMKKYTFSMLQTTQWLIKNKKTGKEKYLQK
ncbi:MAG: hypothetical protein N3A61_09385, partial [Ignavibacteria bacterium]|nr:hypothetical protein [Ignavibacteria bacterium]